MVMSSGGDIVRLQTDSKCIFLSLCTGGLNRMRRRKKESGLKTALLMIAAIIFMIMAISVVVIVFGKIHSDYEKLDMTKAS